MMFYIHIYLSLTMNCTCKYSEVINSKKNQIQGFLPFSLSQRHGAFWGLGCTDPSFDPHACGGCLGFTALPTSNGGHTGGLERGANDATREMMGNGEDLLIFWSHSLLENTAPFVEWTLTPLQSWLNSKVFSRFFWPYLPGVQGI